jgi:hypothetical protein
MDKEVFKAFLYNIYTQPIDETVRIEINTDFQMPTNIAVNGDGRLEEKRN